jgi:GTPase SAR1 family protein
MDELSVDAYVVVFAITDRSSFNTSVDILYKLRHDMCTDRAIILVANKIDIVRKQKVTIQGMCLTIHRTQTESHYTRYVSDNT